MNSGNIFAEKSRKNVKQIEVNEIKRNVRQYNMISKITFIMKSVRVSAEKSKKI